MTDIKEHDVRFPAIILVDVIPAEELLPWMAWKAKSYGGIVSGLVRYDLNTIWIRRDLRWIIFHELTHWLAYHLFGSSCWIHAWIDKSPPILPWIKEFRNKGA